MSKTASKAAPLPTTAAAHQPSRELPYAVVHFDELPDDALVSINDSCQLLDLSRTTLYRLEKKGTLEVVTIGRSRRLRAGHIRSIARA